MIAAFAVPAVWADSLRVATFNTELSRKGPGLLLRDITRGKDAQIEAVLDTLVAANADVIALQDLDYDLNNAALGALAKALAGRGLDYPHLFAAPPNAGLHSDLDLDGDGRLGGPGDAQGFGFYFGQGSMAILSRLPVDSAAVQDFSDLLWRDLPDHIMPTTDDGPFPSAQAQAVQRLSSNGHWVVPLRHPKWGPVHILTFHPTPPVFDGPEDRNGRRNHDEIRFWQHYLEGTFGPPPKEAFVLMGDINLDPNKGDGRSEAMRNLLALPMLQDPLPEQATVTWKQTGDLRVDYVLPSADWQVTDAGVMPANPAASRHRLVWVELTR